MLHNLKLGGWHYDVELYKKDLKAKFPSFFFIISFKFNFVCAIECTIQSLTTKVCFLQVHFWIVVAPMREGKSRGSCSFWPPYMENPFNTSLKLMKLMYHVPIFQILLCVSWLHLPIFLPFNKYGFVYYKI